MKQRLGGWEQGKIVLFRKHRRFIAAVLCIVESELDGEMKARWIVVHSQSVRRSIMAVPEMATPIHPIAVKGCPRAFFGDRCHKTTEPVDLVALDLYVTEKNS